jgi:hypothetical protein
MDLIAICMFLMTHYMTEVNTKEPIEKTNIDNKSYPSLGAFDISMLFCCGSVLSPSCTGTSVFSTSAKLYGVGDSRLTSLGPSV